MKYLIVLLFTSLFSCLVFGNRDSTKYVADLNFHQNNYADAIELYFDSGVENLDSKRIANLIVALYYVPDAKRLIETDILKTADIVEVWVAKGAMPAYIKGVLQHCFKDIDNDFINELFETNLSRWNKLYGEVISKNPTEFYHCNQFYIKDQHLRFLEIDTRKRVDIETFLRADSVNMASIRHYLTNNELEFSKNSDNLFFGVIHHYNSEDFFTKDDFNFFSNELMKYVEKGLIDLKQYCYFVDKYLVFNGKYQKYGTYADMDGLAGVSPEMYEKLNKNRFEIGYCLRVEDQIKYDIR